jgi:hypothetical protein
MNKPTILKAAAFANIIALLATIPFAVLHFMNVFNENWFLVVFLIFFEFFLVLLSIFSMIGFIVLANHYKNNLLKIGSFVVIGIFILTFLIDSLVNILPDEFSFLAILSIFLGGAAIIPFSIGLLKLKAFGNLAQVTGILGIITGVFFLTILLSPFGMLTVLVVTILEIMILFKASKMVTQEKKEKKAKN